MPTPKEGENEDDFVSRCIPIVIQEGTAKDSKQAVAICHSMYKQKNEQAINTKDMFITRCIFEKYQLIKELCEEEYKKLQIPDEPRQPDAGQYPNKPQGGDDTDGTTGGRGEQQIEPRTTRQFNGQTQQLYTFDADCDKAVELEPSNLNLDAGIGNKYSAVAVIGDRFYKNKFVSYTEIEKAYRTMDGAYHDINHWGTTYTDGNPNIEYIVGYQNNTVVDPISKKMKTDININEGAPKYQIWKNFVDINKQAGRTPNVSVSFWGSSKDVKAKDLPKGVNYHNYGYEENDNITYLYDLQFQALSTVFEGACNAKDGCGIGIGFKSDKTIDNLEDMKKILELLIEIEKEKNKQMEEKND